MPRPRGLPMAVSLPSVSLRASILHLITSDVSLSRGTRVKYSQRGHQGDEVLMNRIQQMFLLPIRKLIKWSSLGTST